MRDLHNQIRVLRSISPVAVGTTQVGKIVDRKDYDAVEIEASYGTLTATGATVTLTVLHGDATGSMTSVADADLIGTEALASLTAGARTSGSTKNVTKRVGYTGLKRYVQAKLLGTVTAATPVGVNVILGQPKIAPTSNP